MNDPPVDDDVVPPDVDPLMVDGDDEGEDDGVEGDNRLEGERWRR